MKALETIIKTKESPSRSRWSFSQSSYQINFSRAVVKRKAKPSEGLLKSTPILNLPSVSRWLRSSSTFCSRRSLSMTDLLKTATTTRSASSQASKCLAVQEVTTMLSTKESAPSTTRLRSSQRRLRTTQLATRNKEASISCSLKTSCSTLSSQCPRTDPSFSKTSSSKRLARRNSIRFWRWLRAPVTHWRCLTKSRARSSR